MGVGVMFLFMILLHQNKKGESLRIKTKLFNVTKKFKGVCVYLQQNKNRAKAKGKKKCHTKT
jgi:hypothetical protein